MKKYFCVFFSIIFCTVPLSSYASKIGNKIKSAFKKVEKKVVKTTKAEGKFLGSQAVGTVKNLKAAGTDFKSGNVLGGMKDLGKATYNASNVVTLGRVDSIKTGVQTMTKGTVEIIMGDRKNGFKDIAKGAGGTALAVVPVPNSALIRMAIQGNQKANETKKKP